MQTKYIVYIVLGVAILIGAVLTVNNSSENKTASQQEATTQNDKMAKELSNSDATNNDVMSKDPASEDKMTADQTTSKRFYKEYSAETVKAEQQAGQKVVLFFHAPWCPYCRDADKAFNENLDKIPAGVTLLKTDYDSNTELKKKYGVTYQHTFVQIDNNLDKITSWVSGDIDLLIKNIK